MFFDFFFTVHFFVFRGLVEAEGIYLEAIIAGNFSSSALIRVLICISDAPSWFAMEQNEREEKNFFAVSAATSNEKELLVALASSANQRSDNRILRG